MTIASVEVVPYALPFKEPYVTARGTLERREMVLLRIRDHDGAEGLGEAVPLSLRGGATLETVVEELQGFAERISGRAELDSGRIRGMADAMLSRPASCAFHIALADVDARRGSGKEGGPRRRDPVPCNATLAAGEPVHVAQQALAWAADGFRTFKLKVGAEADVETVRLVREAVGPEAQIRLDANGSWTVDEAATTMADLEPHRIELVEQPVATFEEMAALKKRIDARIAADESVASRDEAEQAKRTEACDLIGTKLSKVGGPSEAMNIAIVLPCYLSSALDGPVGIAAAALAVNELRGMNAIDGVQGDAGLAHGLATQRLFAETIASVECELRGDMLHLPEGPGLGVEIDEDALARHRL